MSHYPVLTQFAVQHHDPPWHMGLHRPVDQRVVGGFGFWVLVCYDQVALCFAPWRDVIENVLENLGTGGAV